MSKTVSVIMVAEVGITVGIMNQTGILAKNRWCSATVEVLKVETRRIGVSAIIVVLTKIAVSTNIGRKIGRTIGQTIGQTIGPTIGQKIGRKAGSVSPMIEFLAKIEIPMIIRV